MKHFEEFDSAHMDGCDLRNKLETKGYVLIRDLLPRLEVAELLRDITGVINDAGWLIPGHDPFDRIAYAKAACGDPDPRFKKVYQQAFNLARFHALPHHPALSHVMKLIVGDCLLVHPKPIGRLIFPNCERLRVHAHQDYRFMGGDPECFTVWIPLHDCPEEVGPLRVLEGSHRLGIVKHEDENLHVPEIPEESLETADWVGGQINAGDVLIFHSLTVHGAAPNVSNKLRISLDCRFQDYRRPVNPANLAFAGESGKSWENTYSTWKSDDLKYYWKYIPLRFEPTKDDLFNLSINAKDPAQRARYTRILSQLG